MNLKHTQSLAQGGLLLCLALSALVLVHALLDPWRAEPHAQTALALQTPGLYAPGLQPSSARGFRPGLDTLLPAPHP